MSSISKSRDLHCPAHSHRQSVCAEDFGVFLGVVRVDGVRQHLDLPSENVMHTTVDTKDGMVVSCSHEFYLFISFQQSSTLAGYKPFLPEFSALTFLPGLN